MSLLEELAENGADINDGLARMMNNQALYERLLKKLPDSIAEQEVLSFIDSGDIETATKNAHTIKGVTGNLSISPLYKNYTEIVNLLRSNKVEEARKLYVETVPVQKKFIELIQKYSV